MQLMQHLMQQWRMDGEEKQKQVVGGGWWVVVSRLFRLPNWRVSQCVVYGEKVLEQLDGFFFLPAVISLKCATAETQSVHGAGCWYILTSVTADRLLHAATGRMRNTRLISILIVAPHV